MKNGKLKEKLRSFGFQMAFFHLVLGLAVIILFSGVVYTVTTDIFVKEAVSKTQMAIEKGADGIGQYMRHAKSLLQIYAKDTALVDFVTSGEKVEPQANILKQLTTMRESDPHIFEVFILLPNGQIMSSTGPKPANTLQDMRADTPCLSSQRADSYGHADQWIITIGVPILGEKSEILGTLAMDLDHCLFMHTVSDLDMGVSGNISIVTDDGAMVFHTDKALLHTDAKNAQLFSHSPNDYNPKTNSLTHSVAIPNTQWTMVGQASLDGLTVLKRQISDMVVLTGVLLFVTLFAITATVSKKLTQPLSRLTSSMEDIKSLAELSEQANAISEMAVLTKSYNRMVQRIKQLMQELEEKQSQLRTHELEVLSSQINPHFLYNTLDTIVWLAEFRDNDKIIALTKSLAAFFRLSLNGGKAVVSLQDEIQHVKQYLFIQKERYGDKLTYSFTVDDAALECIVPKIILQPIVENAIYHGIKPMDGTGHIKIEAHINGTALVLRVCDNGVGMQEQADEGQSDKQTGGVGLR